MYSIWVMVAQGGMEGGCALGEREKGGGGGLWLGLCMMAVWMGFTMVAA